MTQAPLAVNEGMEGAPGLPPLPEVRLGSGTAWSVAMQATTAFVNLIVGVMVARALGPDGKGTLSIVQQAVAILLVLGDLGIGLSAVYHISKRQVRPGVVLGNASVALVAVSAAAAFTLVALFRSPMAVARLDTSLVSAALAFFVVSMAMSWIGSIAVGIKGVRGSALPSIISALVGLMGVAGLWLIDGITPLSVLVSSATGVVLGLGVAVLTVAPWLSPVQVSRSAFTLMRRYSARLYVATAADFLHFRQDVLMLGWFAGVSDVGVYSVGVSIAEIATRLPSAMGAAIQAKASRISHESALDLAARAIRLTVALSVVVIGSLCLGVWWLIPALFGTSFSAAVGVFYALMPGAMANALIWPISSYQSARGQVYWGVSLASVVLNIAVNMVLIPRFGPIGAAIASSGSYALLVVALVGRLTRDTGMRADFFLVPTVGDLRVVVASARTYLGRG